MLGSASLEVLVLKGREATQFSLNWKLNLLTGHLGLLMLLNQQVKNELMYWLPYWSSLPRGNLLQEDKGEEDEVYNPGESLQSLLVLPCTVIEVNESYGTPNHAGPWGFRTFKNDYLGHSTMQRTLSSWGPGWGQREHRRAVEEKKIYMINRYTV